MSQFDDLKSKIIFAIWIESQRPGSKSELSMSEIEQLLPTECLTGQTRAAIESLGGDGSLSRQGGAGKFYISETGIRSIEYDITHPGNLLYDLNYAKQLGEAGFAAHDAAPPVPAADRVVALDHNSDPYRAAVAALDEAVAAFKADHLLANEWGPEKSALITVIETGRALLNETSVRVATLYATVLNPLRIIRDRYSDAIAAGLVTAAVDHLVPLLERAVTLITALIS
jgi:hypothetical protein